MQLLIWNYVCYFIIFYLSLLFVITFFPLLNYLVGFAFYFIIPFSLTYWFFAIFFVQILMIVFRLKYT